MNIAEILKDCPKGTKVYSPVFGEGELSEVISNETFPIEVFFGNDTMEAFTKDGRLYSNYNDTECILFPSKENRDWSTFKEPKKEYDFKPFDKVLVRDKNNDIWRIDLFAYTVISGYKYQTITSGWAQCIPFEGNEHLLGTSKCV